MDIRGLKCYIKDLNYRYALVAPEQIEGLLSGQQLLGVNDAGAAIGSMEQAFPPDSRLPSQKVSFSLAMGLGGVGVLTFYRHGWTLLRRLAAACEWDIPPLSELPHRFWLKMSVRTGIPIGLACLFGKLNQQRALPELIGELKTKLNQGE